MRVQAFVRVVLATGVVLASGCTGGGATGTAPGVAAVGSQTRAPLAVSVERVRAERVRRSVALVGTLHGDEEAVLSNKVVGRIQAIRADVGDVVSAGAVLAELETRDFELAESAARRSLEAVLARLGLTELPGDDFDLDKVASVARAQAELANARAKLARYKDLEQQSKSFVAEQTLKDAETNVQVWIANVENERLSARAHVAEARQRQAELEIAKRKLSDATIRAPQGDGARRWSVAARLVSEGEYLREGTALFRVVASNPLKLRAAAPERYVGDFKVGLEAVIKVEAYGDREFPGRIARVNPSVDPANRTFGVEITVPNDENALRPGSFARAEVYTREEDAILVPLDSIVSFAGVQKVFTIDRSSKAHEVLVVPGRRHGASIEVVARPREALAPGARVVMRGQSVLADGATVTVAEEKPTQ